MKLTWLLLLLPLLLSFPSSAEKITVAATDWKGVMEKDGSGIYLDLLRTIYGSENLEINFDSYNRNLNAFKKRKVDILIGAYRDDVTQATLPNWFIDTENPIKAFYLANSFKINKVEDFSSMVVSWVRGYHFEKFLPNIDKNYLVNSSVEGFNLLAHNRIDAFIGYHTNVPKNFNASLQSFEILPARKLYVAFQNTEQGYLLARQFDQAMAKLKKNGTLESIYQKSYLSSGLKTFNEQKEKIVILTDEVNLLRDHQNNEITYNDTLSRSINMLFSRLNQYQIEIEIWKSLADIKQYQGDNVCFSDMLKTQEREQHYIFSQPSSIYLSQQLYSKSPINFPSQPINLTHLFKQNPSYKIGLVSGRSYGDTIDEQLRKLPKNQIVETPAQIDNIIAMFHQGKFDILLEYPQDVSLHWSQMSNAPIYSYPVDHDKPYFIGYMMCNNSAINSQFIKAFNQKLASSVQDGSLLEILASSIPKNKKTLFEQYFREIYPRSKNNEQD